VVVHFDIIASAKSSDGEIEVWGPCTRRCMRHGRCRSQRLAGIDVAVQMRVHGHEVIGVEGGSPILRRYDGCTDEVFANHVQQEQQARRTRSNVGTGSRKVPQRATGQPTEDGQDKLVGSDILVAIQCWTHDDDVPAVVNIGQEAFKSVVVLNSGSLDKVGNHG
jgi:hypothetical protein